MSKIVLRGPAPLMSPLGLDEGVRKVGALVSINGVTWRIPRGEEVYLPSHVVAFLKESGFVVAVAELKEKSKKGA